MAGLAVASVVDRTPRVEDLLDRTPRVEDLFQSFGDRWKWHFKGTYSYSRQRLLPPEEPLEARPLSSTDKAVAYIGTPCGFSLNISRIRISVFQDDALNSGPVGMTHSITIRRAVGRASLGTQRT